MYDFECYDFESTQCLCQNIIDSFNKDGNFCEKITEKDLESCSEELCAKIKEFCKF